MNTKNIIDIMITICCLVYTGHVINSIFDKVGFKKGFIVLGKILFYSTLLAGGLYISSKVVNFYIMKGALPW